MCWNLIFSCRTIELALVSVLIGCIRLTNVHAFPAGSSGCFKGIPSVASSHYTIQPVTSGSLAKGELVVIVNEAEIKPSSVTDEVLILSENTVNTVTVYETGNSTFKGVLMRIEVMKGDTSYVFISDDDDNDLQPAIGCYESGVQGVVQATNKPKSFGLGMLTVSTAATIQLDVTVVDYCNPREGSQFWFSSYTLQVGDGGTSAPTRAPRAAPAPIPAIPATNAPVTPAPTPAPICFAGDTIVHLENGSTRTMQELQIGDRIKVPTMSSNEAFKYEPVYAFAKRNATIMAEYLHVTLKHEKTTNHSPFTTHVDLSAKHMLALADDYHMVPASMLQVGDKVALVQDGRDSAVVQSIRTIRTQGAYAPLTFSGSMVVNHNVAVSAYVSWQDNDLLILGQSIPVSWNWHSLAHTFLAPIRWLAVIAGYILPDNNQLFDWLPSFFALLESPLLKFLSLPAPIVLPLTTPVLIVLAVIAVMESVLVAVLQMPNKWMVGALFLLVFIGLHSYGRVRFTIHKSKTIYS